VATSAASPPTGIDELVDALDVHRGRTDLGARRLRARRLHALSDFVAEHGERGLRALGGRRGAEKWLAEQEPGLDVPALDRALATRAAEAR
jgi:LAO/AO transport system kinase